MTPKLIKQTEARESGERTLRKANDLSTPAAKAPACKILEGLRIGAIIFLSELAMILFCMSFNILLYDDEPPGIRANYDTLLVLLPILIITGSILLVIGWRRSVKG